MNFCELNYFAKFCFFAIFNAKSDHFSIIFVYKLPTEVLCLFCVLIIRDNRETESFLHNFSELAFNACK